MPPKRFRQTRKVICEKDDDGPWVINHCRIDSKYVDSNDTPVAGVPPGGAPAPPKSSFFSSLFGRRLGAPAPASTAAAASTPTPASSSQSVFTQNPMRGRPGPNLLSSQIRTPSSQISAASNPSVSTSALSGASSSPSGASSPSSVTPPPLGDKPIIIPRAKQSTVSGILPGGPRTQVAQLQATGNALQAVGRKKRVVVTPRVGVGMLSALANAKARRTVRSRKGGGKISRRHIELKKSHKNSNKQHYQKKKNRRTKRRNH